MIDVAAGDKIPRKGGPGNSRSDLLVINKIDLAPYVDASLEVMARDAAIVRAGRPFLFCNLRGEDGVGELLNWITTRIAGDMVRLPLGADGRIKYAPNGYEPDHHHAGHNH